MRKLDNFFIIILCHLSLSSSFGQILPLWQTNYVANNPSSIDTRDMAVDKHGNVYVIGYIQDTTSNNHGVLLKYNTNGQILWVQNIDTIQYYSKITVDDSSNVYVTAHNGNGLKTFKFNSVGNLKWKRTYASSGWGIWTWDIKTDDLGNVYVAGNPSGNRTIVIKYDYQGNLKWANIDTVNTVQSRSFITVDYDKNVYVVERFYDTTNLSNTCKTIKYDSSGMKMWQQLNYGNFTNGSAAPIDIKYHSSGFIYMFAASNNNNNGQGDYYLVKYDTLGNEIWSFSYSFTTYYDIPKAFTLDQNGNAYLTGNIYPSGGGSDSIATLKVNKNGIFEWKRLYSGGSFPLDEASDIAIDSSENIYVTGRCSGNMNSQNYVTIKYDTLGNQIWSALYKHTISSWDTPVRIGVDNNGNVYVTGISLEANSSSILTLKYSNTVGIAESTTQPELISKLFPNPFLSSISLEFNRALNNATLFLYDALGKMVLQIDSINSNEVNLHRNSLKAGMYFFRIVENNQEVSKGKIVAN